jgi:surfeit locus 1 family protein
MALPPVPMPEKIINLDKWEYRRVTLAGKFLHAHEFLIKPRTLNGVNGYHMLTPFQRASGEVVFVNRGWVGDAELKTASRPTGLQQIEVIVVKPHTTSFTPINDPIRNDWYWADVTAMGDVAQLKNVSPILVSIASKTEGVYPQGGKVQLNIRNDHKQYAIFWFTMAALLQIIFILRHYQPVGRVND